VKQVQDSYISAGFLNMVGVGLFVLFDAMIGMGGG